MSNRSVDTVGDGDVTAVRVPSSRYPRGDDGYSPSRSYPEIVFAHRSRQPNPIYDAVRTCLQDAGLDREHAGTPEWNPLREYVKPGARVFILCNFVQHRRPDESQEAFEAKCTHASVLRPVIDYVLKALGPEGTVGFGNSPIQSAEWPALMRDTGCTELLDFYSRHAAGRVVAHDLRGAVLERHGLRWRRADDDDRDLGVHVDLGSDSLLEGAAGNSEYRGLQYSAHEMAQFHRDGKHVYAVSSTIASSDILISIPKLKTHEKVGVTLALKGCVGATALKQCLAHHRKGSVRRGGDEYPAFSPLQRLLSAVSDRAWNDSGTLSDSLRLTERVLSGVARRAGSTLWGGWHGNDTCWRMALDIARCAAYASPRGLEPTVQRRHLVFMDGVMAGEGQGPLHPTPRPAGWLSFATDPFASDYVSTFAMGFDPAKIPVVREAARLTRYPVTSLRPADVRVRLHGTFVTPSSLGVEGNRHFATPRGWSGSLEWNR